MCMAVGRHINGITLNDLEYLLDDDGEIRVFDNESTARDYLLENGCVEEDLYWFIFEEVTDERR